MKKPLPIVKLCLAIVRITLLHIVLYVVFSGFALASTTSSSFGQEILDQTLSISVENKKLRGVLLQIEKSASIKFSFNPKSIPVDQKISVGFRNKTLKFVLDSLLTPLQVGYEVSDNYVILSKTQPVSSGVRLFDNDQHDYAQVVSGIVSDEINSPLPGVNVLEKGTTNGTTTDANGRFSLSVADENSILVFSFIGFVTQEVVVGSRSEILVSLQPDVQSLDEVVVVAYGSQQKRDLTSSVASLKARDFGIVPAASAEALLQGKAAGVQVVQNSGQPGGEVFVRIRGTSSLLGESRPLYVIDGVPMTNVDSQPLGGGGQRNSALADINPNDIESIDILKDAAAAALYGSRGSNGVVLITTKRGKSGEAKISFDAYYGVQEVTKKFDLLNGEQYVDLLNDARINSGNTVFEDLDVTGVDTNWQDQVFRSAPVANYNFSISGGNDKLTAFFSLGNYDQSGTLIGQEYTRRNGRLNLDYKAKKFLTIGTNTTFSTTSIDQVGADLSTFSVLGNALFSNPNVPVRNDDGSYGMDPLSSGLIENPVMVANALTHNANTRRLISNLYAEVEFLKNFKFRSTLGIDLLTQREERYVPSDFIRLNPRGNAAVSALFSEEFVWQNENTLQYSKDFDKHNFSALVGFGLLESNRSFFSINGITTASDLVTTFAASDIRQPNHNISSWGLQSTFARVNYGFDNKYLFEASVRRDGSSRFGRNNRFGVFPSVSGAWRISAEEFMSGLEDIVNDLKLRASYGLTGNQDGIDNFGSLTQYAANANYNGTPAVFKSRVGNPDLRWESTAATNIGLDFSFLGGGRIDLSLDGYVRETNDLFYSLALPRTTGFTEIQRVNLGSLENRGLEINLTSRNLVGEFTWTTNFNIAFNRNKITELAEFNGLSDRVIPPNDIDGAEGPYGLFRVGEPIGNFYGYRYLGIWGTDEYPTIPDGWGTTAVNGDVVFEDVNGNFRYGRLEDHQLIGNALPKHTGGLTNSFGYKGIDLTVTLAWSYGNDIYNMTRAVMESMATERNQFASVANRWTPQNPNGDIPRAFFGTSSVSGAANNDANSKFVEDGSFLRMRNVTLGYSFPQALLSKLYLTNARVYVSAQNLLTFTNYTGLDPENQNLGASQGAIPSLGVDFLTQPQPRVLMMGVNIGL